MIQQKFEGSQNNHITMFTGGRQLCDRRLSSLREGPSSAPALSAVGSGGAKGGAAAGPRVAQSKSKKDCRGLKYLGTISNNFQEESVEIFLGSFHQQALIAEAKRVLSQPRNRGLGVELMPGVAAVGVGRNSIGAVVTTSRPHKKVACYILCIGRSKNINELSVHLYKHVAVHLVETTGGYCDHSGSCRSFYSPSRNLCFEPSL